MPPRTASPRFAIRVPDVSRRDFIRGAASIGGGLMLGIYLPIREAVGQENATASTTKVTPPRKVAQCPCGYVAHDNEEIQCTDEAPNATVRIVTVESPIDGNFNAVDPSDNAQYSKTRGEPLI